MKRATKWLIAALILILVGTGVFCVAMTVNGWDFTVWDTTVYTTNTVSLDSSFTALSVDSFDADIIFVPSADGSCSVTFFLPEKMPGTAVVADGKLTIEEGSRETRFGWFRFSARTPKITVSLPAGTYESLTILDRTGDVIIPADFAFSGAKIKRTPAM